MQSRTFFSVIMVSLAATLSHALPTIQENSLFAIGDSVKTIHPEAYNAFLTAPLITFDGTVSRRQEVPDDSTPDPDRPIVTPPYVFVLQCDVAGFRGNCLSFGAAPGKCGKQFHGSTVGSFENSADKGGTKVNYSSFNSTQAFLDENENKTSSLSTNTGGNCQFYKSVLCPIPNT